MMVNLLPGPSARERRVSSRDEPVVRPTSDTPTRSKPHRWPWRSRPLWTGDIEAPPDGLPPFEARLFSGQPRSFPCRFAARGRETGHGAARKAVGWHVGHRRARLIAAQTVDSAPWEVGDQAVLVELVGFGAAGESWLRERRRACTGLDGELIWRGRSISHVIGDGPHIDEVWVTGFTDERARDAGMEAIAGVARETGVETWWIDVSPPEASCLSRSPADTEG